VFLGVSRGILLLICLYLGVFWGYLGYIGIGVQVGVSEIAHFRGNLGEFGGFGGGAHFRGFWGFWGPPFWGFLGVFGGPGISGFLGVFGGSGIEGILAGILGWIVLSMVEYDWL
jgi:hypothetical protein